jgi:hypothetical protein
LPFTLKEKTMLIDRQNLCSDKQVLTTTAYSTDAIDLFQGRAALPAMPGYGGSPIADAGRGNVLKSWAQCTGTFAGGTSLQVQVVQSDNDNLSAHDVLLQTDVIVLAALAVGFQFNLGVMPRVTKRYIGFRYVIVGTMSGAGSNITAGFVFDTQTNFM